ncbi:hypothetical protein CF336_g2528 [Tilletia laevis]|uniref:Uncharacterized protein n=1 Tax=Tilletia caries TaxID=13290 RepID=A0A177VA54_9BASI|nr:hypothetical protein CF336_g2528 [Tilletia laevis]KAE8206881.1 hypothetical protein CF335_g1549 [Tilletia laevis]KAE8263318.1 hypothetical protein A4X03_0g1771 [Tilletia caries]
MSLLLAPYNNAMRLGQGFNSYTQQICIDDAVLIDPDRDENVINNAGLTMKMLAAQTGSISALARMPGLVNADANLPLPNTANASSSTNDGPATAAFDTRTQIQKSTQLTKIGVPGTDGTGSGSGQQ